VSTWLREEDEDAGRELACGSGRYVVKYCVSSWQYVVVPTMMRLYTH